MLGIVPAKVRDKRAWCLCPFHADEKPDHFFVRTAGEKAGTFFCFSCKKKGNLPMLVAHVRGVSIEEARELVKVAGKNFVPLERRFRVVERAPILGRRVFELPPGVVLDRPLADWPTLARRYAEQRGLTDDLVALYGIGYAVDGELAGRVVFPARGPKGEVLTYSARTFVDEEPKYRTPSIRERPDLGAVFGEHLWPPPGERDVVAVTEGALDAIAVHAATGVHSTAIGGSDVRTGHLLLLATWRCVIAMTDGDAPGDNAARALAVGLGRSTRVDRLRLGRDANTLLVAAPDLLRRHVLDAERSALARANACVITRVL